MFEHCRYDGQGQLLNASLADYLVPMAGEMPDIDVAHCVSPTRDSELGAKGAGEAEIGEARRQAASLREGRDIRALCQARTFVRDLHQRAVGDEFAVQRALDQAPAWLIDAAGGPTGLAEKIFRGLTLEEAANAGNTLAPGLDAALKKRSA